MFEYGFAIYGIHVTYKIMRIWGDGLTQEKWESLYQSLLGVSLFPALMGVRASSHT